MILRSFCWWFVAYMLTRANAGREYRLRVGVGVGIGLGACPTLRNGRLLSAFSEESVPIF